MRYIELISEDFASEQVVRNFATTIKQNCQSYLKQNKHAFVVDPLFRGIKPPGGFGSGSGDGDASTIRKKVRLSGRRATDMEQPLHDFYNKEFSKLYGGEYRNAVFVNGSPGSASDYGTVYVIFPAGNFTFIWSEEVEDLYVETQKRYDDYPIGGFTDAELSDALADGSDLYNDLWHGLINTYRSDNIVEAIEMKHEIMIRCEYYYGIHADVRYNLPLSKKIEEILYK